MAVVFSRTIFLIDKGFYLWLNLNCNVCLFINAKCLFCCFVPPTRKVWSLLKFPITFLRSWEDLLVYNLPDFVEILSGFLISKTAACLNGQSLISVVVFWHVLPCQKTTTDSRDWPFRSKDQRISYRRRIYFNPRNTSKIIQQGINFVERKTTAEIRKTSFKTTMITTFDKSRWVKNLSNRQLSSTEIELLSKGMNFSTAPKRLPTKEIIANVENAVKGLEKAESVNIRAKLSLTLQTQNYHLTIWQQGKENVWKNYSPTKLLSFYQLTKEELRLF